MYVLIYLKIEKINYINIKINIVRSNVMLCSRCKKRTAVVFVSSTKTPSETEGLCAPCAKEIGVKPVEDMLNKMGVSAEEFSDMQDQFSEFLNTESNVDSDDAESENDDDFIKGGATTFPFIKGLFSNMIFPGKDGFGGERNGKNGESDAKKSNKKSKRKHLGMYCTNLTERAKNGELDKVIGRDKEINRTIQILCRRTKNNPCLIGQPGVGKTAIVEGLALKISSGDVPHRLKNKEIYLLDLTSLVAGTQFRGQFESRIKGLIEEVKKEKNIILFIDEVHNLVGTGDSDGTMNAANILKPALSRGEIQVIGATTFEEYRKHIEKDAALERRFQPVKVSEPSIDESVEMLKGVKEYYEKHHRVKIPDYIVNRMVVLSERYITDRFLPDKAIDLMDESATYCALNNKDLVKYDVLTSEIEKLKKEEKILSEEEKIDYERLADIRCKMAKSSEERKKLELVAFNKEVSESDIARVIELWTGIPFSKIQENEFKKLEHIEDDLKKKIIGQDEAINVVAAAIRRNRLRLGLRRRPASFIFVGSTGVGKTELVKALTEELFDSPDALIRLDMSEYMEKHSASKIVGSPPGYVGYDEAGQLTEKVRQRPYSVILFDEIEKAHPDVMNILLQVLDEGKITDSHGRNVNFENTVIVMTSNAGSNVKDSSLGFAKSEDEAVKEKIMKSLKEFLRPEFIGRVDEIVIFNKLKKEDYKKIAELIINEYKTSLKEKGINLFYDEKALEFLADKSINGKSGARDIRNLIRRELEDKVSLKIIQNGGFDIGNILLTANPNLDVVLNKN